MGGLVFNLIYAKALHAVRSKLNDRGILLHLPSNPQTPFWSRPKPYESTHIHQQIAEATFVDDEALFLCAKSPKLIDKAINGLLKDLIEFFGASGFNINWSPGKTEAILQYR
eukprot:9924212-Karenia_brevis.AAC.1